MKLTETTPGCSYAVRSIEGDSHLMNRITAIGITEGAALWTVKNDPKMPVLIYLRETLIALNRNDAERISVERDE